MGDIDWKEVREIISNRTEAPAEFGLEVVIMQTNADRYNDAIWMYSNAARRHIVRASAIDLFSDKANYYQVLAEFFGFDKGGKENLTINIVKDAAVSNVYSASIHLYQSFGALGTYYRDLTFQQLEVEYISPLLSHLDSLAKEVLDSKRFLREGDFLSNYVEDKSFSHFRHWDSLSSFMDLRHTLMQDVLSSERIIGKVRLSKYHFLSQMIESIKKY